MTMKRCLDCNASYDASASSCPSCDFNPGKVVGFDAYAPDLAHGGGGFAASYFSDLARLEDENFWFRGRNKLILWALEEYCPGIKSYFEIGCGTGYVLSGISRHFPQVALYGSEIFVSGLEYAAERLPAANLMQMDARRIPFETEFDVIGAFDVLEHIEEDETVLTQVHRALNPQGFLLITVPQHQWLWSAADEYACHVRRYAVSDLHDKIERAGFQVARSTSFVTTLLPAMMVSRLLQKRVSEQEFDARAELQISPWLNAFFLKMLHAELWAIRMGLHLPIGGSRLVVAQKVGSSQGDLK